MKDTFIASLALTEEQQQIVEAAQEVGLGELKPRAMEIDESAKFPKESVEQLSELGFMGILIPDKYDGMGLDMLSYALVVEELSYHCASTALVLCVHNSVGANPIAHFGSDEQKEEYLPKLASGELIGAFALTEPNYGSDAGGIQGTAKLDGDEYVLNGRKMFITNAKQAGLFIVVLSTDKDKGSRGLSAFIVPADTPGLTVGRKEDKMGMRGSETNEVILEDARIPAKLLLGKEGQGFKVAMVTLDGGRIGIGAQANGIARAALDEARKHAKDRVQFGKPIGDFEAIQWKLADMATNLTAARHLVCDAARRKDRGISFSKEAAMAKLFATEKCNDIVRDAVQIFGGYGYTKEYPVERLFRDAKVTEIYEGTSEMQRLVIARHLLKED